MWAFRFFSLLKGGTSHVCGIFPTLALTCVIVIVDCDCGRVVVAQHGFGRCAGVQRGSADLRITNDSRVTEVDVEILVLLKDVVVNHSDGDLW